MKRIKNQLGFTVVEGLLVILILVVIGGIGYMVYHNDHKTSNTNNTVSKTTTSSSKSTTASNPYAGWQQLCSSNGGLCMKYPSSWKLSGSNGAAYAITSPSGTTAVEYLPNGTRDAGAYSQENAGNCPSDIVSITPLSSASGLDIVQAITNCTANINSNATSSSPSYSVISGSEVKSQSLKAGATDNNALNISITNIKNPNSAAELLYINDLSNSTYTTSTAAQAWLSSADVQTAGKILSSVSYSN